MDIRLLLLCIISVAVPVIAWGKKSLSLSAAIVAFAMIAISSVPGPEYAFYIVISFVLISIIDKIFENDRTKKAEEKIVQKSGTRDVFQVLANGIVAIIAVILWIISKNRLFLICYCSAIAESLADSAASSIGVYFGKQPYDICRLKKVEFGTSGGVSIPGTIGCFLCAGFIAFVAYLLEIVSVSEMCIITASSFIGCIGDSVMGSIIQRKNKCPVCNVITEKHYHCNERTQYYSGARYINNDTVNFLSNILAAMCSIIGFTMI